MPDGSDTHRARRFGRFVGLIFMALILTVHPGVSRGADAVAMVTDFMGRGLIVIGHAEKPCEILSYLPVGAEVRIDEGSTLSLVFFRSSREYLFTGKAAIRIDEEVPKVLSGAKPRSRNLTLARETGLLPSGGQGYEQTAIVLKGTVDKRKVRLLGPKNTKVLTPNPVFRWEPVESATQYRFTLMDDSGRALIETRVDGTAFKLPPEIRLTEARFYTWQVDARLASCEVYSSSADFSLLERAERERINRLRPADDAPFSELVLFAAMLEREGLRDEAHRYWKRLAAKRPDDRKLKRKSEGVEVPIQR